MPILILAVALVLALVLPLRALVAQKVAYFTRLLAGTGLSCAAYFGGAGEIPLPKKLNLAVCTIEKAAAIVQHLAESNRLHELVACARQLDVRVVQQLQRIVRAHDQSQQHNDEARAHRHRAKIRDCYFDCCYVRHPLRATQAVSVA